MIDQFISFLLNTVFGNLVSIPIIYLTTLSLIKVLNIWKIEKEELENTGFKSKSKTRSLSITKCPKCGNKCSRISRDNMDKSLNMLSFKLMKWKRYSCPSCYWEGNRWD